MVCWGDLWNATCERIQLPGPLSLSHHSFCSGPFLSIRVYFLSLLFMKQSGPFFKARFLPTWQGSSIAIDTLKSSKKLFFPQLNRRPETWREHPAWFSFTINSCWNSQVAWLFSLMVICDVFFVLLPCYPVSHAVTESAVSRKMPLVYRGRAIIGSRCLGSAGLLPRLHTREHISRTGLRTSSPSLGPMAGQRGSSICIPTSSPAQDINTGVSLASLESISWLHSSSCAAPLPPCVLLLSHGLGGSFSHSSPLPCGWGPQRLFGAASTLSSQVVWKPAGKTLPELEGLPVHSAAEEIHLLLFFLGAWNKIFISPCGLQPKKHPHRCFASLGMPKVIVNKLISMQLPWSVRFWPNNGKPRLWLVCSHGENKVPLPFLWKRRFTD